MLSEHLLQAMMVIVYFLWPWNGHVHKHCLHVFFLKTTSDRFLDHAGLAALHCSLLNVAQRLILAH